MSQAEQNPASNWLARGGLLGALVGALVVAIPLLDLSRTNYKFPMSPELVIFALVYAVPGMLVGLIVGLIGGAIIRGLRTRRPPLEWPNPFADERATLRIR